MTSARGRVPALLRWLVVAACAAGARSDLLIDKQSPKTVLSKVPVFLLTNDAGQPYLTSTPQGDQVGKMFIFLRDAEKNLDELKRMPGASDARMWKTDLHRAVRMAQRAQSSGLYNEQGRELRMLMRFHPHTRQQTNAKMVYLSEGKPFKKAPDMPVFVAEGLSAKKRGTDVVPLFFSKEELDRTWSRMALKSGGTMPKKPKVTVTSLGNVMQTVATDPKTRVDFFIPEQTEDWVKDQKKTEKARIFRPRRQ